MWIVRDCLDLASPTQTDDSPPPRRRQCLFKRKAERDVSADVWQGERVAVKAHLGVEAFEIAFIGDDERVDLKHLHVFFNNPTLF